VDSGEQARLAPAEDILERSAERAGGQAKSAIHISCFDIWIWILVFV
jgi:hypothetical protein